MGLVRGNLLSLNKTDTKEPNPTIMQLPPLVVCFKRIVGYSEWAVRE